MHRIRLSEAKRSELLLDAIGFNLDIKIHMESCPDCAAIDDPCPVAETMLAESKRKAGHLNSLGLLGAYNG